ncbi:MAG: hypothetical protein ACRC28_11060 [Clostridium sp.]|uniref:hypothetical protein n=1 Tax=Clostridium sp. TaxID=1506 RepID=UPI003F2A6344
MSFGAIGIILIIIIYKGFINSKNGKTKKVKDGIFIVPLIFLYFSVEQLLEMKINIVNIGIVSISIIIGIGIGMLRARFYEVKVNSEGEVVYKRHLFDILILVVYLVIKIGLDMSIGYFDKNLINAVEAGALFMALASITVRRIKIYMDYLRLKGKLNG